MLAYRLYMSDTMSISASAAAIFSAEVGCGRAPKRKDIVFEIGDFERVSEVRDSVVVIDAMKGRVTMCQCLRS